MTKTMKRLLATAAVLALLLASLPLMASAEGLDSAQAISTGTNEVTLSNGNSAYFSFAVDESGVYNLYSTGNYDTYIRVEDTDGEFLASDDDGGDMMNFFLQVELEKGTTVLLETRVYSSDAATFSFTIEKAPAPTGVELFDGAEEIQLALFEWRYADYLTTPHRAYAEQIDFVSDNESVLGASSWGDLFGAAVGETSFTVTLNETVSDTVKVTVREPILWDAAKPQKVMISPAFQTQTFAFTVEADGYYELYSEGEQETYATLYEMDEDGTRWEVFADELGDLGEDFHLLTYLEADTTYYLNTGYYSYYASPFCRFTVNLKASDIQLEEEGVTFSADSLTVAVGEEFSPKFLLGTEEYDYRIESADESIVYSEYGVFYAKTIGETTLKITAQSGATDTLSVKVVEPPVVKTGEKVTVSVGEISGRSFSFTPDADGIYVFRSYSDMDTIIALYDADWEMILSDDDSDAGLDFCLEAELKAGETYYIVVGGYNSYVKDEFELSVEKGTAATSVTLGLWDGCFVKQDGKTYYAYVGSEIYETVTYGDTAGAMEEYYEFVWENEELISHWIAQKPGTTTGTVTTVNGLTDTITVIVIDCVWGDLDLDGELTRGDLNALTRHLNGTEDLGHLRAMADYNGDCTLDAKDADILKEMILAAGGELGELGDVNGDEKVNTTDARVILQYAAGLIEETQLDLTLANVNGDDKVNTTDARDILKFAAGLIPAF